MISTPTFGACIQSGIARCVLAPQYCNQLEVYRPARAIKGLNGSCNMPTDINIGRCTGSDDQFKCAASRDYCYLPLEFDSSGGTGNKDSSITPYIETLSECNLQFGEGNDGYSLFPLCRNTPMSPAIGDPTFRCVTFKEECTLSTEDLIVSAEEKAYNLCRCHDVPVGVCYPPDLGMAEITNENSYCAVGAWDCRDDHISYLNSQEALELPNMTCRLCDGTVLKPSQPVKGEAASSMTPPIAGTNEAVPPSPVKTPFDSQPSTTTNDVVPTPSRPQPLPESSEEAFVEDLVNKPEQTLSLVGLILGSAVGMFLLMLGVGAVYKRLKKTNEADTSSITFKGQSGEESGDFV